jgi:hypothetical protein
MVRALLILATTLVATFCYAQTPTYRYEFNGSLNGIGSGAPSLQQINTTSFVVDNVPSNPIPDTLLQFNKNAGIKFIDNGNSILADSTYAFEMLVKFDNLSTWSRVVDYFGGTSDEGIYILNGKINYYARALANNATIIDNEYLHLTIMRNNQNKAVRVFANGTLAYNVFDTFGVGIGYGSPRAINFFADDTVVANEASSGKIAWLNVYDSLLTDSAINAKSIAARSAVTSASNYINSNSIAVYPNPAVNVLYISGLNNGSKFFMYNAQGAIMLEQEYYGKAVDVSNLAKGFYYLKAEGQNKAIKVMLQ